MTQRYHTSQNTYASVVVYEGMQDFKYQQSLGLSGSMTESMIS